MSRDRKKALKEFLQSDGYLLVFTAVCGLTLFSYFLANREFGQENQREVLGSTSALKGVWVNSGTGIECPEMRGLDVEGCITDSYFENFNEIEGESVNYDREGRVVYSNDEIFVSGIFEMESVLNNDVWKDVYLGNLNLKINSRQWVFEDVVWNKAEESVLDIIPTDTGYLVIFYPSITLTSRTKQFWVFEYSSDDDMVRNLSFVDSEGDRAYIESSYVSVLQYGEDTFLRFDRLDPSLMGNVEVGLYEYSGGLELFRSFLLLKE
jgi:hypothetical protein